MWPMFAYTIAILKCIVSIHSFKMVDVWRTEAVIFISLWFRIIKLISHFEELQDNPYEWWN